MKNSILGFNQRKLVELGLSLHDALILRYFVDFKDTGKMKKEEVKGENYYWIKYEGLKESLPILNISKDRIYRKLRNLVDCGILKHKTIRKKGTYSFYTLGERYAELIEENVEDNNIESKEETVSYEEQDNSDENVGINDNIKCKEIRTEDEEKTSCSIENIQEGLNDHMVKIPEGFVENTVAPKVKTPYPYGENNGAKNYSLKDSSLRDDNLLKDIIINIVDYLNKMAGTKYKVSTKNTQVLIKKRLEEGFSEEDFKNVIDKKVGEWGNNTHMVKYLRPETLFGHKFESYLNQKEINMELNDYTSNSLYTRKANFNNYPQRTYDGSDGGYTLSEIENRLLGWQ